MPPVKEHALRPAELEPLAPDHPMRKLAVVKGGDIRARCDPSIVAHDVSGSRTAAQIRAGVVHCTGADSDDRATALYFHTAPGAGSTQLIVDDDSCFRTVGDLVIPWGAPPLNTTGWHVEHEGPVDWPAATWLKHLPRLERGAYRMARAARAYGWPMHFVWDASGLPDDPAAFHGITCHSAISNKWHQSTHQDPGPGFPYKRYEEMVRSYFKAAS